jgi:hypothetical protein
MQAWIYQLSRKADFFEKPGDITKAKLLEVLLQTPVHTWGIRNYFRDALPGDPLLFKIGAPEALGVVGIATIEKSGATMYRGSPGVRFRVDRRGTTALSKNPIPFEWIKRRVFRMRANLVNISPYWNEFARELFKRGISVPEREPSTPEMNGDFVPEVDTKQRLDREGREILRRHRSFERSRTNREKILRAHKSPYSCEACGFQFGSAYGIDYSSYIQVHHKKMVSRGEYIPKVGDFALLCANCHAVAHWKTATKPLSVESVRKLWTKNGERMSGEKR